MMKTDIFKRPFDLQIFADEGGSETENTTGENTEDQADTEQPEKGTKDEGKGEESDKKYTEEEFQKRVDQKFAEIAQKFEKKAQEKAEAEKLAKMSDEEKQKAEFKKLQAELAELKEKAALTEMSKTARAILDEKKIHISDNMLSMLVTSDAEQTKKNVDEFTNLFNEAVAEAVKERVKGKTPPAGTGKAATITKEEIMKIADQEERQRMISENLSLFTK